MFSIFLTLINIFYRIVGIFSESPQVAYHNDLCKKRLDRLHYELISQDAYITTLHAKLRAKSTADKQIAGLLKQVAKLEAAQFLNGKNLLDQWREQSLLFGVCRSKLSVLRDENEVLKMDVEFFQRQAKARNLKALAAAEEARIEKGKAEKALAPLTSDVAAHKLQRPSDAPKARLFDHELAIALIKEKKTNRDTLRRERKVLKKSFDTRKRVLQASFNLKHKSEDESYLAKCAQLEKDLADRVAQEKKILEDSLDQVKKDLKKDLKKEFKKDFADKVAKNQAKYDTKVAKDQADYDSKVAKDQADYDSKVAKDQADYDTKVAKDQADYDIKVAANQANYDAKVKDLQTHENNLDLWASRVKKHLIDKETERETMLKHLEDKETAQKQNFQDQATQLAGREREIVVRESDLKTKEDCIGIQIQNLKDIGCVFDVQTAKWTLPNVQSPSPLPLIETFHPVETVTAHDVATRAVLPTAKNVFANIEVHMPPSSSSEDSPIGPDGSATNDAVQAPAGTSDASSIPSSSFGLGSLLASIENDIPAVCEKCIRLEIELECEKNKVSKETKTRKMWLARWKEASDKLKVAEGKDGAALAIGALKRTEREDDDHDFEGDEHSHGQIKVVRVDEEITGAFKRLRVENDSGSNNESEVEKPSKSSAVDSATDSAGTLTTSPAHSAKLPDADDGREADDEADDERDEPVGTRQKIIKACKGAAAAANHTKRTTKPTQSEKEEPARISKRGTIQRDDTARNTKRVRVDNKSVEVGSFANPILVESEASEDEWVGEKSNEDSAIAPEVSCQCKPLSWRLEEALAANLSAKIWDESSTAVKNVQGILAAVKDEAGQCMCDGLWRQLDIALHAFKTKMITDSRSRNDRWCSQCRKPGHFTKDCTRHHWCRRCGLPNADDEYHDENTCDQLEPNFSGSDEDRIARRQAEFDRRGERNLLREKMCSAIIVVCENCDELYHNYDACPRLLVCLQCGYGEHDHQSLDDPKHEAQCIGTSGSPDEIVTRQVVNQFRVEDMTATLCRRWVKTQAAKAAKVEALREAQQLADEERKRKADLQKAEEAALDKIFDDMDKTLDEARGL